MANQLEDDGLKDLQAKMNATKAKGKNMDKEDDEDEKVEEEGNEDEFIEMLESQASELTHDGIPFESSVRKSAILESRGTGAEKWESETRLGPITA